MVREYSYRNDGATFISPHFQIGEFKSYCDDWGRLTTDTILIDDNLPVMLEKLYAYLDDKFGVGYIYITSGYRSYDFEMYLAGFCGFHYQGKATDIVCYDRNNNIIAGTEVACVAQMVGFDGIGYIGNAVHVDVRGYKSWFDETKGCIGVTDFYDYFGVEKPTIPNPVERDTNKIQLEVLEEQLYCRVGHSIDSMPLGFISKGIYNFIQYYEDGTYTWYEIEKGKWVASNSEWIKILNIEIPPIIENPIEEPIEKPIEEPNLEPIQNEKENPLLWLIDIILNFIIKILNKKTK